MTSVDLLDTQRLIKNCPVLFLYPVGDSATPVGGQTIATLNYTIVRALTCVVVQLIFLTNESS